MPEEWQAVVTQIQGITVAVGGLFALANCFFGYKLQRVWITLAGFFIGLVLGFLMGIGFGLDAGPALLIGVALGIVLGIAGGITAGVLAVKFLRPVIILTTGVGYGLSAGQMLLSLFHITSMAVILPVGGALALAGVIVQFSTTKAGE